MNVGSGLAMTGGGTICTWPILTEASCLATAGGGTQATAVESTMTTGSTAMGVNGDTAPSSLMAVTSTEECWEIGFATTADDKNLFLWLFEPTSSGVLSKKKEEQWPVIQSKILPQLSQAAMIAREDTTYRQRSSVLISELKELMEMDSDNNSADDVEENRAEA
jgi:hypothetical protein